MVMVMVISIFMVMVISIFIPTEKIFWNPHFLNISTLKIKTTS